MATRYKRLSFLLSSIVVLGLLVVACAPAAQPTPAPVKAVATPTLKPVAAVTPAASPKNGGTLKFSMSDDPQGFDPHALTGMLCTANVSTFASRLVSWPTGPGSYKKQDPLPSLAESWEMPNDTTYVFHLRKGVKWHNRPPVNGREFISDDVKWTFDRIKASKWGFKGLYESIASIETPDKYTVKFNMKDPYAPFMTLIGSPISVILAKEAGKPTDDGWGDFKMDSTAVGTGPWVVDRYEPSVKAVYKKNPDYFRKGLPYLDAIEWIVMKEEAARMSALRTGSIDIPYEGLYYYATGAEDAKELMKTASKLIWDKGPAFSQITLSLPSDKAPFSDIKVRRAISMAIDRKAWINTIEQGEGEMAGTLIVILPDEYLLPIDQLGTGKKNFEYNLEEAKKLMGEAGYANGFETTLSPYPRMRYEQAADLLASQLAKLNIKATIDKKEYGAFVSTVWGGKYDGIGVNPWSTKEDPDFYLFTMFHSKGGNNWCRINDTKLDSMIEEQRKTLDKQKRIKIIQDIQRYLAEQMYTIPATYPIGYAFRQPWVMNFGLVGSYTWGDAFEVTWLDK